MDAIKILDRQIAFHRVFVTLTGRVTASLMLSQAIYWANRTDNPDGWFFKTQEDWEKETGLTRREQETARKELRKHPFWHEERRGIPARLFFKVDSAALSNALTNQDGGKRQTGQLPTIKNGGKRQTVVAESAKLDSTKAPNCSGGKRQTFLLTEATTEDMSAKPTAAASAADFPSAAGKKGETEEGQPPAAPPTPATRTPSDVYADVLGKPIGIREQEQVESEVPDAEAPEFERWLRGYSATYGIRGVAKTVGIYVEQRDKARAKEDEKRKGRLPGTPFIYPVTSQKVPDPNASLQPTVAAGNGVGSAEPVVASPNANPRRRFAPLIDIRARIAAAKSEWEAYERRRGAANVGETQSWIEVECPF